MNRYVGLGEAIGSLFVVCRDCGSLVVNKDDHDRWHADLATAVPALPREES